MHIYILNWLKAHIKPQNARGIGDIFGTLGMVVIGLLVPSLIAGVHFVEAGTTIRMILVSLLFGFTGILGLSGVMTGLRLGDLATTTGPETFIFSDGKIQKVFQESEWYWKGDYERTYGEDCIRRYGKGHERVSMSLQPITINPKVRPLKYEVAVETCGTPELAILVGKTLDRWKSTEQFVLFHLYNFNEGASKVLSEFFNPLEGEQQERFEKLVKDYLEPYLQDTGMSFKSARFSLPH